MIEDLTISYFSLVDGDSIPVIRLTVKDPSGFTTTNSRLAPTYRSAFRIRHTQSDGSSGVTCIPVSVICSQLLRYRLHF